MPTDKPPNAPLIKPPNKPPMVERVKDFYWQFEGRSIPLGVGCAYFGDADDYRDTLTGDLKLMERLYSLGLRYFDTSRTYHNSEQAVGEFVSRIDRKSIFLATKSKYPFRQSKEAFSVFRENFFASFERLKTDYIDLFQIHDTDHFDCCEPQVMPFLQEQQRKGLIGYIGLGTRSLNAHELAILSGGIDSVLSYINYSLLKRSAAHVIDVAKRRGVAFINASVFHFGTIKHPDPLGQLSKNESGGSSGSSGSGGSGGSGIPDRSAYGYRARNLRSVAKMQALCREMGVDIARASLQYSLFDPGIALTLNGIRRDSNIDSTVAAMREVIYPEQWARIRALQEEDPYLYVQDDLL
ncbi:MAG: aldo/keto reductase [Oscillospiraceae bacterium]|nr:aldo/keto reductase [Oscillospiraceae bacterium]